MGFRWSSLALDLLKLGFNRSQAIEIRRMKFFSDRVTGIVYLNKIILVEYCDMPMIHRNGQIIVILSNPRIEFEYFLVVVDQNNSVDVRQLSVVGAMNGVILVDYGEYFIIRNLHGYSKFILFPGCPSHQLHFSRFQEHSHIGPFGHDNLSSRNCDFTMPVFSFSLNLNCIISIATS